MQEGGLLQNERGGVSQVAPLQNGGGQVLAMLKGWGTPKVLR